jgi:hypothetical protein
VKIRFVVLVVAKLSHAFNRINLISAQVEYDRSQNNFWCKAGVRYKPPSIRHHRVSKGRLERRYNGDRSKDNIINIQRPGWQKKEM